MVERRSGNGRRQQDRAEAGIGVFGFLVAGGGRGGRDDVQLNTNDIKKLYCRGIRASLENMAYLPLVP
jgi:hypothetical protein